MGITTSSTSASTLYGKPIEYSEFFNEWVRQPTISDTPDWEKRYWDISRDLLDMQASKNKLKEELDRAKAEAEALRKALGDFIGKPI